jgi:hypothetical protein
MATLVLRASIVFFTFIFFKEGCMQLKFSQALAGMRQAQQFCDANDPALGGLIARGARAGFDSATTRLAGLAEAQEAHRIQASGELANERRLASDLRR